MSTEELDFVMTFKGDIRIPGTAKVDRTTARLISMNSDDAMAIETGVTKAPEDMVPADERGPFKMDLTMTMTQVEVRWQRSGSPAPAEESCARPRISLGGRRG